MRTSSNIAVRETTKLIREHTESRRAPTKALFKSNPQKDTSDTVIKQRRSKAAGPKEKRELNEGGVRLHGEFDQIKRDLSELKHELLSKRRGKSPSSDASHSRRSQSRSKSPLGDPEKSYFRLTHGSISGTASRSLQKSLRQLSPYQQPAMSHGTTVRMSSAKKQETSGILHEGEAFYYEDSPMSNPYKAKHAKGGSGAAAEHAVGTLGPRNKHGSLSSILTEQSSVDKSTKTNKTRKKSSGRVNGSGMQRASDVNSTKKKGDGTEKRQDDVENTPTFVHRKKMVEDHPESRKKKSSADVGSHLHTSPAASAERLLRNVARNEAGTSAYYLATIQNLNNIIENMKIKEEVTNERVNTLREENDHFLLRIRELERRNAELEQLLQPGSAAEQRQQQPIPQNTKTVELQTPTPAQLTSELHQVTKLSTTGRYHI
jgi:hypothetical protein